MAAPHRCRCPSASRSASQADVEGPGEEEGQVVRKGQRPYALPDGTVISVDVAIPDTVLDRLNKLPNLECRSTCSGGHRPSLLENGVEKPAPAPMVPRWDYPAVLLGRMAKAGFYFIKPGNYTFPEGDINRYRIYDNPPELWVVAPVYPTPPEWREGLCQLLEGMTMEEEPK